MTQPSVPRKTSPFPVIIALFLLVVVGVALIGALGEASGGGADEPTAVTTLTTHSYETDVAALLAGADAQRGEALTARYGCISCHEGAGAENHLAPEWEGVATRAETRRPPLSAAAYIYESIIHPTAFEIEGYSANMPLIYDRFIPKDDLGDVIAYLLTLTDD